MKVAIIMGSMSDLAKVEPAISILKKYDVKVDVRCLSAHRAADELCSFVNEANNNGTEAIIAAAGMAAALPGVVASQTILPVIGIPVNAGTLGGLDAMLSTIQMPSGIPVATVAINGAVNAALLAIQILAVSDDNLAKLLAEKRENDKQAVLLKNQTVENNFNN